MADETTHTETSAATDQTAETTTTETGAETVATTEATTAASDDLSTALGGEGETSTTEDEGKTEGAEAKAEVPDAYELTPPEGFDTLDADTVAAATPVFKELGLSNDQAQKLIPVAGEFAKKIVAQRDEQLMGTILDQRKEWLETAKADPEIGGANWDATLGSAAKALDQLGFPKGSDLRVSLDESGYGNHPELIRLLSKVGKAIGEDGDFGRAAITNAPKTDAELFYGRKD